MTKNTRGKRGRGLLRGLLALALTAALGSVAGTVDGAHAAEVPDAIHDVTVAGSRGGDEIAHWERLVVTATWQVPDRSAPGDTFGMHLPAKLEGLSDSFALLDDDGAEVATCTVAETEVRCTLGAYVTDHPLDVGGSLAFSGVWTESVEYGEVNHLDFDTGDQVITVEVPIGPRPGPYRGGTFSKSGTEGSDGRATWWINLPQSADGLESDLGEVVLTEFLGPNQDLVSITPFEATGLNDSGSWPAYAPMDESSYTIQGSTITFDSLQQGHYYSVRVISKITPGTSGPYTNRATVAGSIMGETSTTAVEYEAGGDGSGNQAPSPSPTPEPSDTPTPRPSDTPTPEPSDTPTPEPSDTPTPEPSDPPTPEPSDTPTPEPSDTPPAESPTGTPSAEPVPSSGPADRSGPGAGLASTGSGAALTLVGAVAIVLIAGGALMLARRRAH